jgi:tetratricopeptide (TPR) repeat protein
MTTSITQTDLQVGQLLKQAMEAHQQGAIEAARQGYQRVVDSAPEGSMLLADGLHLLGLLQLEAGDLEAAQSLMIQALAIAPNHSAAHNNLGLVLQSVNRHADAIDHFKVALKHNRDYLDALLNLGSFAASG